VLTPCHLKEGANKEENTTGQYSSTFLHQGTIVPYIEIWIITILLKGELVARVACLEGTIVITAVHTHWHRHWWAPVITVCEYINGDILHYMAFIIISWKFSKTNYWSSYGISPSMCSIYLYWASACFLNVIFHGMTRRTTTNFLVYLSWWWFHRRQQAFKSTQHASNCLFKKNK
jgi:hypothetical protein